MTEQEIQRALGWHYGIKRGCIPIPNVLMDYGRYEADFIYINQNNYLTEIEIKVSFQDFKADFTKKHYHDSTDVRSLYYAVPYELYSKYKAEIHSMAASKGAGIITLKGWTCNIALRPKIRRDVQPLDIRKQHHYMRLGCMKWFKYQYDGGQKQ